MIKTLLSFPLLIFLVSCNNAPEEIAYGSDDGKYLEIYNTKIYYEEYGQGTPLLLLSGGGIIRSIRDFEKCIPELSKHYRVIVPDSPGQGRSEVPDTLTYELLSNFFEAMVDSLKLDSAYVMGWSDGGVAGILLAEKRSDKIRKVIAVGPNNGLKGAALPGGITVDSLVAPSAEQYEGWNKKEIDEYMKTLPRDWKKHFNSLNKMWYQKEYFSDSLFTRIKVPVMIVLGDRDEISLEHGVDMYRLIKGSQFCVLPNTTHEVFKEQPGLITKIAIEFFE